MKPRPALPEAESAPVPPLPDGWDAVACAALRDGKLAILGARGRADEGAAGGIWTFDGRTLADHARFPLHSPFPIVDRFPDGRWLVAETRADECANARILAPSGGELGRLRLGDGIEHLKIDSTGQIWIGWFDEGIFGNQGWAAPGADGPPSRFGVAAFDEAGAVLAHAETSPDFSPLADCYALNEAEGAAWACTYMDFPILKCGPGAGSRWWPTGLSGPRALAVRPPYVLAAGGYSGEAGRLTLVHLDEKRGKSVGRWALPFLPEDADFLDGRGAELHAVHDGVWHRWRIDGFIAGSGAATPG